MSSSPPTRSTLVHSEDELADNRNSGELMRAHSKKRLLPYSPPDWAKGLQGIPNVRIELSTKNTPIQKWHLPGIPDGFEVYIKRDDLTGCSLSGNKARKLEFLLAEALDKGHDTLIGCGQINSNLCRALACAGRELGFNCHLLMRPNAENTGEFPSEGNAAMIQLVGANVHLVPPTATSYERDYLPKMKALSSHLRSHSKMSPYLVPVAGTSPVGLFGPIECFEEMRQQGVLEEFSDLVVTSGGTSAGFCIGNYLTGQKMKLHGMVAFKDTAFFHRQTNDLLQSVGLQDSVHSEDLITMVEGVAGRGYGLSTDEELEFIQDVATHTGIFLDPIYTGKVAFHMIRRLRTSPDSFRGNKILFYNSGSVLGLLDGRTRDFLKSKKTNNKIHDWTCDDLRFPVSN